MLTRTKQRVFGLWGMFCLLQIVFLVAGCSTPYHLPPTGEVATVTVLTGTANVPTSIRLYENETCEKGDRGDFLGSISGDDPIKVFTVPAGHPITLQFHTMYGAQSSCVIPITFVPEAGEKYSLQHAFGGFRDKIRPGCQVKVDKIRAGMTLVREPTATKNETTNCAVPSLF